MDPEFTASEIQEDHAERVRTILDRLGAASSGATDRFTLRVCLETSPEVCLARTQSRNRQGENGICKNDLAILARLYNEFWTQKEADPRERALRLDAGLSVQELVDLVVQEIRL